MVKTELIQKVRQEIPDWQDSQEMIAWLKEFRVALYESDPELSNFVRGNLENCVEAFQKAGVWLNLPYLQMMLAFLEYSQYSVIKLFRLKEEIERLERLL